MRDARTDPFARFEQADRDFNRVARLTLAVGVAWGLLCLALLGLAVWAVVRLVLHFT